ncbi:hypothetical protein J6590_053796 [Homalodisca vitripennis]|nr:hypothetical protein J6590_053796 [Homalodisca vitripennis]
MKRTIIGRCLFLPSGPGLGWLPTRCDLQMAETGRSTPSLSLQSSTTMRSVFSPVVSSTPKMRRFWRRWNCSSSSQRSCSRSSISSSRWVKVPTCSRSLATSSPTDASAARTASSTTPFSSWVMRVTSWPKTSPEERCLPTRSAMTVASTLAALSVPVAGIVHVVERPGSDVTDKERSDRCLSAPPDNGTGSPLDPDLSCGGDRRLAHVSASNQSSLPVPIGAVHLQMIFPAADAFSRPPAVAGAVAKTLAPVALRRADRLLVDNLASPLCVRVLSLTVPGQRDQPAPGGPLAVRSRATSSTAKPSSVKTKKSSTSSVSGSPLITTLSDLSRPRLPSRANSSNFLAWVGQSGTLSRNSKGILRANSHPGDFIPLVVIFGLIMDEDRRYRHEELHYAHTTTVTLTALHVFARTMCSRLFDTMPRHLSDG